jgi:phosphoribosylformimino-5-aminoimidazole carboxamide ribotide isomerase
MLLIIPSIEIKNGQCVRSITSPQGYSYSFDPVEMATVWRKENAKSLHVTDYDGTLQGRPVNLDVILKMVKKVDIPIEVGGGYCTYADVEHALSNGIYRIVIGTLLVAKPDDVRRAIDKFGASKIVIGVDMQHYRKTFTTNSPGATESARSLIGHAAQFGIRRVLYTDRMETPTGCQPRFDAIKEMAETIEMKMTVSGGINGLGDLQHLQEFEPLGVDSVIIGRALYENKFSCQGLWRICEAGNFPYTAKV